jgi:esterase/lipase superfamily enzyme
MFFFKYLMPWILAVIATSTVAKELRILVPSDIDPATTEFLETLITAPEVKAAGLAFKPMPIEAFGPTRDGGSFVLKGVAPFALLRTSQIPGFPEDKAFTFTSLLSHPLIVSDAKEQFYLEDSIIGDLVMQEVSSKGFAVLGFWNAPSTSLVANRPVASIDDLQGLRIRAPSFQAREVLTALGATPAQIPFGEIYAALEQRAIDGAETGIPHSRSQNSLLNAAKGGSVLSNFERSIGFLLASESSWIDLKEYERAAIQSAAQVATTRARDKVIAVEASLPEIAKAGGLSYVNFSEMGDLPSERSRNVWLRIAGVSSANVEALKTFDDVRHSRPQQPKAIKKVSATEVNPTVLFATNRNDEGGTKLATRFGIARDPNAMLTCGEISYAPEHGHDFGEPYSGEIRSDKEVKGNKDCATLISKVVSRTDGRLVIFVHGYSNTSEFAIRRTIALAKDLSLSIPMLVWMWPSQGTVGGYGYDVGSVDFTRPYINDFLSEILKSAGLQEITIIAHSMGGRIAMQMVETARNAGKTINNVVFVAPDIPRDIFVQGVHLYKDSMKITTMYANEFDRALALSRSVNRQAPAGLAGASLLITEGVDTIDVSQVASTLLYANHAYAFDVPQVANDLSAVVMRQIRASMRSLRSAKQNQMTYWIIAP